MKKLLITVFAIVGLGTACSVHKIDVQQGNVVTAETLDALKIGMDKERVRFLMGTPPVADPFHQNRWDYIYTYQQQNKVTQRSHVILRFDDQDKLVEIKRDKFQEYQPIQRSQQE